MTETNDKPINKGGRPKVTENGGKHVWIANNCLSRYEKLAAAVKTVSSYEKELEGLKNPSALLITALRTQHNVDAAIGALSVFDNIDWDGSKLSVKNNINTYENNNELDKLLSVTNIETTAKPTQIIPSDTVDEKPALSAPPTIAPQAGSAPMATANKPESTQDNDLDTITTDEFLSDAPETPTTRLKQAEWCESAPIVDCPDYDGTSSLKDAFEKLYGKTISSNDNSAMTRDACDALGIVRGMDELGRPRLIKDAPTRARIYQWHCDKVAKIG
jgi:hypothetical protein